MDAVKFVKEKHRMCNTRNMCLGCEIRKRYTARNVSGCDEYEECYPEEVVSIVEEWSIAHPIVTNGDKLQEVFGNVPEGAKE